MADELRASVSVRTLSEMATAQYSRKKKKVGASKTPANIKPKEVYCELCRIVCYKKELQDHMHSLSHHRELEAVLGKDSSHECHACKETFWGLSPYSQHISTDKHQAQMVSMKSENKKPRSLHKVLGTKLMTKILERNKREKKSKKKKKNKKKMAQLAASKKWGENLKQVGNNIPKWSEWNQSAATNNVVCEQKQNNVCSRQNWLNSYSQAQFSPSADQPNISVRGHNSKRDGHYGRHRRQAYPTHLPRQIPWSAVKQHGCCSKSCEPAANYTSDHLPQTGVIIFNQPLETSQVKHHASQRLASPSSAEESTNVTSSHHIGEMLRQIRRELGVREPCRAEREARKQIATMGSAETPQLAGGAHRRDGEQGAPPIAFATSLAVQSAPVSSHVPYPDSGAGPSSIAPTEKSAAFEMGQEGPEMCGVSSGVTGETKGPPSSKCAPSEPEVCNGVQMAQTSKEGLEAPEASSKLSVNGVKRKRAEEATGTPRFANNELEQDNWTQMEELPLSEGFHWESIPDSPSFAPFTGLPPPVQNTPRSQLPTEPQFSPLMPEASKELPKQDDNGRQTVTVKVESNSEEKNGSVTDQSTAKNRTNTVMTVSDEEPDRKKVRMDTDKEQMDQLLVVSLREEKLNNSLEDLDKSLFQARNTLQAAYAEVQRLLLLKQQYAADVNSLRAKRIEILQGMQEGRPIPGESPMATGNASSSTGRPAATPQPVSPRSASAASSGPQPPQARPASSTSQPHPASLTLPDRVGETPELPSLSDPLVEQLVRQPLPMFAPTLIPPLLLPKPPCVDPAPLGSFLPQATVHCSPSVTEATRKSFVPEQEQLKGEELTDCGETAMSNIRPTVEKPIPLNVTKKDQNTSASVATEDNDGKESDASVEIVEPRNQKVINVDSSDREELIVVEPPQESISRESSATGTKTSQQNEEGTCEAPLVMAQVSALPPAEVKEEELSLGAFENHQGPVYGLEVYQDRLYTCSGDNTARASSLSYRDCQAVFTGHTNKINCLLVSSAMNMLPCLFTGSSDETIRCYSIKTQKTLEVFSSSDRVLCLHSAWNVLFAGLASGSVASFDLKTLKQLDVFNCHGPRGVSCLGSAQEGARRVLLVGSYDSTISVRDARTCLLLRTLEGHTKTVLCMKVVNDLVFSGSSDTSVHAHNIHTGELVRVYKGHGHAVASIAILGNVMVTACLDKLIRVFSLKSHDCLQVYGGHSDAVMCMAVYKSVIYTGCNDGSIQAVKINLMKNFHCWWQNCSLIYGVKEHLTQHLLQDHTNPNLEAVRCRWRSCTTFFAEQQSVKQELPEHMRSHVEDDAGVML